MRAWVERLMLGGGIVLGVAGCAGSPTAPTAPSASSATIDAVVTSFRGAMVTSEPLVVDWPEALQVEVAFTVQMPAHSRMTIQVCVMETASAIGIGTCIAVTGSVADLQARGPVRLGISTYPADKSPATTHHVHVAIADGVLPPSTGLAPPRRGDVLPGGGRVLATSQVPRTVTFRQ